MSRIRYALKQHVNRSDIFTYIDIDLTDLATGYIWLIILYALHMQTILEDEPGQEET